MLFADRKMDNMLQKNAGQIIIPYNTQAIVLVWYRENNAFIYHFLHAFTTWSYIDHYYLLPSKMI